MATVITVYGEADAQAIVAQLSAQSGNQPAGNVLVFNVGDPAVAAYGGINPPDSIFTKTLPDITRRIAIAATNANGWNVGAGRMSVKFRFRSTNFFQENPGAHMAIALRCDVSAIATQPRFAGMIIGTVIGATNGADHGPTTQLESRATGLDSADPAIRFLYPRSEGGAGKPMLDNVDYQFTIHSTLTPDNQRKIRYTCEQYNTTDHGWDLIRDTGDVTDANTYLDYTQIGYVIGFAFENPAANPYTVAFTQQAVTWGPAEMGMPETGSQVDRYGARIESDLQIIGNGRTISGLANGATYANYTKYQNNQPNQSTTLLVAPNGTSTNANVLSTNSSGLVNFGAAWYGMNGNNAELATIGVGSAGTPEIAVKVGVTQVGTYKVDGYRVMRAGASVATSIGPATARITTGITGLGGANAVAFCTGSPVNLETFATPGQIGAVAGANVETVLRPIYAAMSCLLQDLKDRGLI